MALLGGQFKSATHGQFKSAQGGQFDRILHYASALVSRGSLPGAMNPQVQSSNPGQIDFTWEDNSQDSTANTFDKVILVVYNPAKQKAITVIGGNERSACVQTIEVPSSFAGDQVECFIAFQNLNQSVLSNSVYAGPINVFID